MKRKIELQCKKLFLTYNSLNAREVYLISNNIKTKTFTEILSEMKEMPEDSLNYLIYKAMKHLMVLLNYMKVRQLITKIRSNLIKNYNKYKDLNNIDNIVEALTLRLNILKENIEDTQITITQLSEIADICIIGLIYINDNK